ncbi:MAG: hypothetical protein IPL53_04870 [Ignavibacteria bacterium]|nr:hypothetical protein [Ignavibacteria bacterium]
MFKICFFINENTGYTAGNSGAIFKTTDCGVSWINQTNYAGYDINCIQFISDNEGIVAGGKPESERAFIYKTDDGGASWYEVYDSLSLGVLNSVDFMNGAYAIATGNNGNILKTFDKGESWSSWNISSENLLAIDFLNTQNALITGTNGLVYKTTNSGINWHVIISGFYLNLSSVKYYEQNFAVASGDNGKY